ncbi:magnesium chelatase [Candidatus Aerophobetes bacterium]|uniref:Magnesium chelatase n=1 Tax=Aerophobetes bacterium TaxID=2030807 RepID=A0A662DMD0_UNCAE|nr:MAG: magnesium chelatase [Candidatus Aerophobetes bacterium]
MDEGTRNKHPELVHDILEEITSKVIGKGRIIEALLVALLSEGHILLEGNPGTGKTFIASCFAKAIGGNFHRLQMTPDLLPADILGTSVFNPKEATFQIRKGPVFTNILFCDELNRATPKAQAALLEVMQERQVSIEGETFPLPSPFVVIATQIPFGGAGTYPLTEVQIDRFAFKIEIDYPSFSEEMEIISRIDELEAPEIRARAKPEDLLVEIDRVKKVHISDRVKEYILMLVDGLRKKDSVRIGPSPRASIWLFKGARARAYLQGRDYVIPDDVKQIAPFVLSHRVVLAPEAEMEEISEDMLIQQALKETLVKKE